MYILCVASWVSMFKFRCPFADYHPKTDFLKEENKGKLYMIDLTKAGYLVAGYPVHPQKEICWAQLDERPSRGKYRFIEKINWNQRPQIQTSHQLSPIPYFFSLFFSLSHTHTHIIPFHFFHSLISLSHTQTNTLLLSNRTSRQHSLSYTQIQILSFSHHKYKPRR